LAIGHFQKPRFWKATYPKSTFPAASPWPDDGRRQISRRIGFTHFCIVDGFAMSLMQP
jgi:hypothetical protein